MRRISRKTRPSSLLVRLRAVRAYTQIVGEILRDLMPVIVVLFVGAELVFDVGGSLRQLVTLLAK